MIDFLAHVASLLILTPAIGIFVFCTFVIAIFVRVVLWEVWQSWESLPMLRYAASAFLILVPEVSLPLWAVFIARHNKNVHRFLVVGSGLIISILEISISVSIHKTAALEIQLFLILHFAWLVIVCIMLLGYRPSPSLYAPKTPSVPVDNGG
jgi:hypothetical protein